MARNAQVKRRRTYRTEESNLSFDANAEATVTLSDAKHVDGLDDVDAYGLGTGGSESNSGFVVVPTSIGEDANGNVQVTLHAYQGGGAGAPLDNFASSDVDTVVVTAEAL